MAKTKFELNKAQKSAVEHDKGPAIVIAGAGTGKTRVITERIARLLKDKKAKADEVLAVTFTEKAAGEMLDRIDRAMPYGYGDLWVLTFHGLCDRILRESSMHVGMNPGYELITYPMQLAFLRKHIFKEFELNYFRPLNNPYKFLDALIKHVSRLQDEDVSPREYLEYAKTVKGKLERQKTKELAGFYKKYQALKLENSKVDFGDLIYYTLDLFRKRPNVLKTYQDRFKYVLVDEFQDTNFTQNEIAIMLAAPENNIMVVGDDDQAIYRFRGASISNILQFQDRFQRAKKVVLTENYRSVQEILDGAYKVIENNNPYRLEVKAGVNKKLKAQGVQQKTGEKSESLPLFKEDNGAISIFRFEREFDESDFIAQKVGELMKADSKADIAILARAHAHLSQIVDRLCFYGVPYQFVGNSDLFNRPVVKDLMAILRVLQNKLDDVSVYRILSFDGFEISPQTLSWLTNQAKYSGESLWSVWLTAVTQSDSKSTEDAKKNKMGIVQGSYRHNGNNGNSLPTPLKKHASKRGFKRMCGLANSVDGVLTNISGGRSITSQLFNLLKQIDYVTVLEEGKGDAAGAAALYEFLDLMKSYELEGAPSLPELIEYLENLEGLGGVDQSEIDIVPKRGVRLLTAHAAKGLEFDTVIVPSLVRDRFPSRAMPDPIPIPDKMVKEILPEDDAKTQEERRLFYVAMTRAKKNLILTFSDYYSEGKQLRPPSVFLTELAGKKVRDLKHGKPADRLGEERKMKVKEEFVPPKPTRVSFSQLSAYENCPKQYYFRYVLGLRAPPSAVLSFGNTVHMALAKFFEKQRDYVLAKKSGKKLNPPTLEDLLKFYKESWISAGYRNKKYEERRRKSGIAALKAFYEKLYNEEVQPVKLEEGFRAQVGKITVVGKIDRVDFVGPSKVKLIDYKTGSDREKLEPTERLQLAVYAMAVKDRWGWDPTSLSIIRVEGGREIETNFDEKLLDKAKDFVENTVEQIGKRGFPARPGFLCRYCDYRKICNWAKP